MGQYIVRRLLQAIPMLFILSIVLFALVNLAPGGPLAQYTRSRRMTAERKEALSGNSVWISPCQFNILSGWPGMTGWQSIPMAMG